MIVKGNKKRTYTNFEIYQLALAFNKSVQTINRWIKMGNDILTSQKALTALQTPKPKK